MLAGSWQVALPVRCTAPTTRCWFQIQARTNDSQRRYPSQRSAPLLDARVDFDLRTTGAGGPPKSQARWLDAGYGSFGNKKSFNYQMQMGVIFRYDRCPELKDDSALELIAAASLGCKPLVDLAR